MVDGTTPADTAGHRVLIALQVEEADVAAAQAGLARLVRHLPGLLGADVIRQGVPGAADLVLIARLTGRDAFDTWCASPDRAALLAPLDALARAGVTQQDGAGECVWFEPLARPGTESRPATPPLWKRWAASMLAVYPALLALILILSPLIERLPRPVGLFVVAFVLTGLTTAFILPFLTRRLAPWMAAR